MKNIIISLLCIVFVNAAFASPESDLEHVRNLKIQLGNLPVGDTLSEYVATAQKEVSTLEKLFEAGLSDEGQLAAASNALNEMIMNVVIVENMIQLAGGLSALGTRDLGNVRVEIAEAEPTEHRSSVEEVSVQTPALSAFKAQFKRVTELHSFLLNSVSTRRVFSTLIKNTSEYLEDFDSFKKCEGVESVGALQTGWQTMFVYTKNPGQFLTDPTEKFQNAGNGMYRASTPNVPEVLEQTTVQIEELEARFGSLQGAVTSQRKERGADKHFCDLLEKSERRIEAYFSSVKKDRATLQKHKDTNFSGIFICGDSTPYNLRLAKTRLKNTLEALKIEQDFYEAFLKYLQLI